MNPLKQLRRLGQSIWLDSIDSELLDGGGLKRLVQEDGLGGVTSNPSIFQKAIEGGFEDERLEHLFAEEPWGDEEAIFERLAVEDVRKACDVLRGVYDKTCGADGFVSIEVSPRLAHDTEGTVREAHNLWQAVGRPNLMIKVPGTPEGVLAIEALTADGLSVNVTLLFSLVQYEAAAGAFIRGLWRAQRPEEVASVASFFVSRVDTLVDKKLEAIGTPEALALRGKAAVANAKMAYKRFAGFFRGEPFAALKKKGGCVQRPLWASTGTKNPAYSDVLYVQELIGPDTVNTVPPATLDAFRDHGKPLSSLTGGLEEAEADLRKLAALGIDMDAVGEQLQKEGVEAFMHAYETLLSAILEKRLRFEAGAHVRCTINLGGGRSVVQERLRAWEEGDFLSRLARKDPGLWSKERVQKIADRLGWLDLPASMESQVPTLEAFSAEIVSESIESVVLLGMGGSSLAPEVFAQTFAPAPGHPKLLVCDSTHPAAIKGVEASIEPARTLFLVSSKSGTTIETLSLFRYFWDVVSQVTPTPGRHFAAITDPLTPLERLGVERSFRKVFLADPSVGGRYSALSHFGVVPAALLGVDVEALLEGARSVAGSQVTRARETGSPALALGAALGEMPRLGRDKATLLTSPSLAALPAWIEQLLAESTGKDGMGVVPVAGESLTEPGSYGSDRFFIHVGLSGEEEPQDDNRLERLEAEGHPVARVCLARREDLGGAFFLFEVAVAAAGAAMGINPFDQPDVELAKNLAWQAMGAGGSLGREAEEATVSAMDGEKLKKALGGWLSSARPADYVTIQAFLAPRSGTDEALDRIRAALRGRLKDAVTVGYGPRFLHSTGQLHKGGPDNGVFLQIVDDPAEELPVPETDFSFGALIRAQGVGDWMALKQRGRRVLRLSVGREVENGLARILESLDG